MKLYEYLDKENKTWGPITEEELDQMPKETLAREQGAKVFRPRLTMVETAARKTMPVAKTAQPISNDRHGQSAALPSLLMLLGIFGGGLSIAVGIPLLTYAIVLCFWAGLCAAIAQGADMRAKTGYIAGAFLGPLGILLMIVLVVVRSSKVPKKVSA